MKPIRVGALSLSFILLCLQQSFADQRALTLTARVSGGTPNKGQVIISLFTSPANYLKAPVVKKIIRFSKKLQQA